MNELNKGISEQDAKTLASKLKDAMMKRLDAEPHGKDTAKDAGVAQRDTLRKWGDHLPQEVAAMSAAPSVVVISRLGIAML